MEEEEEGGSAEDEKTRFVFTARAARDVCESRVRLAPVVVSVTSTGPGGGPPAPRARTVAVSVGPRAG